MSMEFCHLHTHTSYSVLDGVGSPKQYAEAAADLGFTHLSITDHGNVNGAIKFQNACKDSGIVPIFGAEMYIVEDVNKHEKGEKRGHITLLAKNDLGWMNILSLISKSNIDGFFYRPRIDPKMLLEHCDGLIIMSACASSYLQFDWGYELLESLAKFKSDDLYFEVMPHNFKEQKELNLELLEARNKYGFKLVATNDCHYIRKEDEKSQEVLLAVQTNKKWNDKDRWKFQGSGYYLKTRAEMSKAFRDQDCLPSSDYKRAIETTLEIADKCKFEIKKLKVSLPRVPKLKEADDEETLKRICDDGLFNKIEKTGKDEKKYRKRYEEELKLVIKQGFARYFLIVWDLVNWCKSNDILVGPGRGSAGGSLICYLMGITGVDPLEFGLVFARFISPDRIDLPDIDLDFEDIKRPLIRKHLEELYGAWSVVGVSTYSEMKGKGALRDVSRVFSVPLAEVNKASATIVTLLDGEEGSGHTIADAFSTFDDGIAFKKKYPEVSKIAINLEGQIRNKGQHAAAIVIADEDLREGRRCAYTLGKDKTLLTNWDKDDLEYMGLMKLDVLGLKMLTVLNDFKERVKNNHGKEIDFSSIPLEGRKIFREFSKGNNIGCFQVGSPGLRKFCQRIGIEEFMDLVHATSLFRPGTLRCLTGDTEIVCWNGNKVRIDELDVGRPIKSSAFVKTGGHKFIRNKVKAIEMTGEKIVYEIEDSSGNKIKASGLHKFWIKKQRPSKYKKIKKMFYEKAEWVEVNNISVGDQILVRQRQESEKQKDMAAKLSLTGKRSRYRFGNIPWNKNKSNCFDYTYNHYKINKKKSEEFKKNWAKKMFSPDKWKDTINKMRLSQIKKWSDEDKRKRQSEVMIKYYSENPHPNEKGINISRPQQRIYDEVKKYFFDAELEQRFHYNDDSGRKRFFNLDISVLEEKINIEFDGDYWHENPGERVEPRDSILERSGWKVIRVTYKTIEEFIKSIPELTKDNNLEYSFIKNIIKIGKLKTYDIMVENQEFPNYVANDFVVHNSGAADTFIKRKIGEEDTPSVHPIIDSITQDTYGIILYQEQVMQLVHDVAGLDWKVAEKVRKIVAKSKGEEAFKEYEDQFVAGCVKKKTLSEDKARSLWSELKSMGSYSFNKSHATSYSVITFWNMWCKTNFPVEYICALLTYGTDKKEDREDYIEEAFRLKLEIRPPKVGISKAETWTEKDGILYAPFIEIKGVGEKSAASFEKLNVKKTEGFYKKGEKKKGVTPKFQKILEDINAYNDEPLTDEEADRISDLLGISLVKNRMHKYKKLMKLFCGGENFKYIKDIDQKEIDKSHYLFFGEMTEIKLGYKRDEDEKSGSAFGTFKDDTGYTKVYFSDDLYKRKKSLIEHCEDEIMLCLASSSKKAGSIVCDDAWFLPEIVGGNIDGLDAKLVESRRYKNPELLECKDCELREECSSPVMPSTGKNNIMIIGEAPGRDEDRLKQGFVGDSGRVIWRELGKYGYERRDFCISNVTKCWPASTKTPTKPQIKKCRKWLHEEILRISPKLVLAIGNTNLKYFLGEDSGITQKNGTTEWNEEYGMWICWTIHPAATLYSPDNIEIFEEGIKNFVEKLKIFGLNSDRMA